MKCSERLILAHIQNTEPDSYVRILFTDYSSAFNTITPATLTDKLHTLGLTPSLCNWVLGFLTGRRQSVRIRNHTSRTQIINTGTPQGCALGPMFYTLFTQDCVAPPSDTTIIRSADDTTVMGLITWGDQTAYRMEVVNLVAWCQVNHLSLNVDKTKKMSVDNRRSAEEHTPLLIHQGAVERVSSFNILEQASLKISPGRSIQHTWSKRHNDGCTSGEDSKTTGTPAGILRNFYRCITESILTSSITVWFGNCSTQDRKCLQQVVKTAQSITGTALSPLEDVYHSRVLRRPTRSSRTKLLLNPTSSLLSHLADDTGA